MKNIIINLRKILIIVLIICAVCAVVLRGITNYERSEFLMDTYVSVSAKGFSAKKAVDEAFLRLYEIDAKMNSHNPDSALNKKEFDGDLIYVINKGLKFGSLSGGLFDITVKPLADLWGITTDHPRVPGNDEIAAALNRVDYTKITVSGGTVAVPCETEIDLGGIAKGYAADEAKKILEKYNIKNAVINLGGNVYAIGSKRVGIQNPLAENGSYMGIIEAENVSVATAGAYERNFMQNGKTYHHILNPKTGFPAETDLQSATVISESSADADAASTVIFMLGARDGGKFAEKNGFSYVLIDKNNKVYCSPGIGIEMTDDNFERAD